MPNFFQRRRLTYKDVGMSQIIDVKAWGVVGDGKADDAPVLNSILDRAANIGFKDNGAGIVANHGQGLELELNSAGLQGKLYTFILDASAD
ncbi:hypothetical protein BJX76DRAFT_362987 [Aspergillus varians]